MRFRDRAINWYLKNIYIPQFEMIDSAGFICEHIGDKGGVLLRETALQESVFVNLERKISRSPGGKRLLYSIGKKFGYRYALASKFTTICGTGKKAFLQDSYFLVRYIESISFGKDLSHEIDYEKRKFVIKADDYIICSKNGLGYILGSGGIAGIWSYMVQDESIEGVQTKCQGRGDDRCEIVCAFPTLFRKMKMKFLSETNLKGLGLDAAYGKLNAIRAPEFAKVSLKDLIDSGILKYSEGMITFEDERHFLCEASLIYILEREIGKKNWCKKILFDISLEYGKKIAGKSKRYAKSGVRDFNDMTEFVANYMSALGWGDISIFSKGGKFFVASNSFPWTKWSSESEFIMFRGIFSGMLSAISGRKVNLKKFQSDISRGFLSVTASE